MDSLWNICKIHLNRSFSPSVVQTRTLKNYKSIKGLLGVPPYKGKTLAQKLAEMNYKDPAIHFKVNIGLPQIVNKNKDLIEERKAHLKKLKNDTDLEKRSRENKTYPTTDPSVESNISSS